MLFLFTSIKYALSVDVAVCWLHGKLLHADGSLLRLMIFFSLDT